MLICPGDGFFAPILIRFNSGLTSAKRSYNLCIRLQLSIGSIPPSFQTLYT